MPDLARQVRENLDQVRSRMADAARRSGRSADAVRLAAVTKFAPDAAVRALAEAGCRWLAESRPQHLWERAERLADLEVQWHMIGHLQRNKVRRTLPLIHLLHSADSPELVAAVDREAAAAGRRIPLLLEVNVSGEAAKHGFAPAAVEPYLPTLAEFRRVEVRGLMCMAALEGGLDAARRDFSALRRLRDHLQAVCPASIRLDELSMGMSGDYETAIEEGATIVRVGSALFEGIEP